MIENIFALLISTTIGVSLLIGLVIVIRPVVLRLLNARVSYMLWAVVPAFLLISIFWQSSSAGETTITFFPKIQADWSAASVSKAVASQLSLQILVAVWIVGALISISLYLVRYRELISSSSDVRDFGEYLTEGLEIDNLRIVNTPLVNVPAVFGFLSAYLILPGDFNKLPKAEQELILKHELFHVNRRDYQVNVLRQIIKSIFWFNPLLYVADKYLEADQEISCDLGVSQVFDSHERQQYAKVLFDSVCGLERNNLLSQWKFQSLVKERIKMLKKTQQRKWHSWIAGLIAACSIWVTSGVAFADKKSVDAIPVEIIEPKYPREAAKNGIEGFVKFEFNIDSQGYPYEIRVVDAEPELVFRDPATKALRQWRFKTNQAQSNVQYTMQFKLQ